jgi:hypothetical protein
MSRHAETNPTRREILQIGGGCLGLSLAGLLRAREVQAARPNLAEPRIKACIFIFQYGGPSHIDTYDMKPSAPAEIRGEFKSIATSVPGLRICEHLPQMARLMHKVALVRGLHHNNRLHDSASIETLTGRPIGGPDRELFSPTPQFFPSYGGALSWAWRGKHLPVAHASLPFVFHNVVDVPCQGGGFLGAAYNPLCIDVDPQTGAYRVGALALPDDLTPNRLDRRRRLLDALAEKANSGQGKRFYGKAFQLLASDRVQRALDLSQEPLRTRERYGYDTQPVSRGEGGGGTNGAEMGWGRNMRGQNLLLARRLVEAGVPFVNVYDFKQQGQNWDAHFKVFNQHKTHLLPIADRSLSALIEDLDARGLLDSTLVVAMGEFGRTPRINREGGRDHWPDCYTALLAGGGVHGGLIHGASDRIGAYPASEPVTPGDLAASIYWRFGLDPSSEIHDQTNRPYKLAEGLPIRKLFS